MLPVRLAHHCLVYYPLEVTASVIVLVHSAQALLRRNAMVLELYALNSILTYLLHTCVAIHAAFESKANVQRPSDREISDSWVIVSWAPLISVIDRNGNSLGAVMGFYITYQVCKYIV